MRIKKIIILNNSEKDSLYKAVKVLDQLTEVIEDEREDNTDYGWNFSQLSDTLMDIMQMESIEIECKEIES